MKRHIFILTALLLSAAASAQSPDNSAELRRKFDAANQRVDSIQKALDECRNNYDTDPQKYGSKIVSLEGMMYEARQQQSILSRQVAQLPQDSKAEAKKSDGSFKGRNISQSPFFKENVSKADQAVFASAAEVYSMLEESCAKIEEKYNTLKSMKGTFDKTESQADIDRMIIDAENLKKDISAADSEIASKWGGYYNARIENYLVMIDKLGNISRAKLESIDLLARQAQSSVDPDETLAPSIADFNAQNLLILAYESALAERLGYTAALDSIKKRTEQFQSTETVLYPDIDFPYRSACTYGMPTLDNAYSYTEISEIPEVRIPSEGVYYSIQLGSSQTPYKQLSTFKGAAPLMQLYSGGYHRYMVGGFRTYAEALKGLQSMQKSFKAPRIICWLDGKMTSTDRAKAAEAANPSGGFSIVIKSSSSSTASVIKEIIEIHASGKNWTSSDTPTGKQYKIMTFGTKEEAAVIAQIIRTKDSSASVEVVENGSN